MNRLAILLDQVVYSGATFVATAIVARALDLAEFGAFALVLSLIVLVVGLQRASVMEPLLIEAADGRPTLAAMRRTLLTVGAFAGVSIVVIVLVSSVAGATPLTSLALCMLIGGLLQDCSRYLALVTYGGGAMLANDLVSTTAQLSVIAVLSSNGASMTSLLVAWGAGACAGPVGLALPLLLARFPREPRRAPVLSRRTGLAFGADYALGVLSLQTTLWTAVFVGGYAASAALRGADSLVGPFRVFLQSLPALLLRRWAADVRTTKVPAALAVSAFVSVPVVICVILILLFPGIGAPFYGASWNAIYSVLPYVLAALIPVSLTYSCSLAIKSLSAGKALLVTRLIVLPITAIAGFTGAVLNSAVGAAQGALVGSAIAAAIYTLRLHSLDKEIDGN